jgi:opacity protein-like surface antigen|tara:strand:- start:301 stop:756 length:456 start_codon:yes stop_codon:yes gene_type:complete
MKRLFFTIVALITLSNLNAQDGFSAKLGINNVSVEGEGDTGFYLGAGYQFELTETIDLEPALLFSSVDDLNSIYVPIMFKYGVTDQMSLVGGPQINYVGDFEDAAFGIDLAFGLTYDVSDEFYVEARYGFQIARDTEFNLNTASIGLGYRF